MYVFLLGTSVFLCLCPSGVQQCQTSSTHFWSLRYRKNASPRMVNGYTRRCRLTMCYNNCVEVSTFQAGCRCHQTSVCLMLLGILVSVRVAGLIQDPHCGFCKSFYLHLCRGTLRCTDPFQSHNALLVAAGAACLKTRFQAWAKSAARTQCMTTEKLLRNCSQ